MSLNIKNREVLQAYIRLMAPRIEAALIYRLEAYVAELQNHAKLSAEYQDQTSNLKSSIGGAVLKNGKPISYAGFEGNGIEGPEAGTAFINSLLTQYPKGYVIIIVAGMTYATYVENYHNLNVLKKTELKMQQELPGILENLKQRINGKV